MTKREKFIVMAYTGIAMLPFDDFHEQVEELMGRPVYTHEFALDLFTDELKEKVKPEFLELCEETTGWRKFDEKDPRTWPMFEEPLVWNGESVIFLEFYMSQGLPFWTDGDTIIANHSIKAWMPIPEIKKEEIS